MDRRCGFPNVVPEVRLSNAILLIGLIVFVNNSFSRMPDEAHFPTTVFADAESERTENSPTSLSQVRESASLPVRIVTR
jgi:hypothetical protein